MNPDRLVELQNILNGFGWSFAQFCSWVVKKEKDEVASDIMREFDSIENENDRPGKIKKLRSDLQALKDSVAK